MTRIVCLSDTHNCNEQIDVPDGDILIHAGDATIRGTQYEIEEFLYWYSSLPHRFKIFVAGNHDWLFETENRFARLLTAKYNIKYLQDSGAEIEGLKIYGAPWQPRFFDWAFNLNRGAEMLEKWNLIPADVDILITHGPPHGILDRTPQGDQAGCEQLRKKVEELRPRAHVFGHIHQGYGRIDQFGVKFFNASNCDESYEPTNPATVFDL
jgi:Icc-related predicted phosphoesterase